MSPLLRTRRNHHWPRQVAVACALAASLGAVAQPAAKTTSNAPATDADVRPGERLSTWLLRQPEGAAAPGLAWRVPQERLAQQFLKNTLLVRIEAANRLAPLADQVERLKLITWLQGMPVTGRVALGVVDPRWLQAHPEEDPILSAGQQLVAPPPALKTIAVVRPNGELCNVAHEPGRSAWDYVTACGPVGSYDWAWVAQPDGRTARVGVAPWNSQPSDEPAPGAWIWAAPRDMTDLVAASEGIVKFLATQGPAPQGTGTVTVTAATTAPVVASKPLETQAPTPAAAPSTTVSVRPEPVPQYQAYRSSGNDWGETGLLQTPSARMGQAGDFRTSLTNVAPYSRFNFMFQPLDWLEAGFRYTSISNQVYAASTTGQSNKDKSIDLKVRLLSESAYVPEMALGFRDLGGTGLFSSEYLVANKRYGDFDFSLGIGWGYMGSSGNIRNPLLALSNRFRTRSGSSSTGGEANFGSFFRGPTAMFGGVAWRTPWEPLTVKLEYEGNDYQHEPQNNNLPQRSPFNIGLEYRYSKNVAFSAGFERGNRAMIGITLSTNVASLSAPKAADPPQPKFTPAAPVNPPGWASTAEEIQSRTEWTVQRIAPQGSNLHVWITESNTVYREARVQQIIAVLHRDAPASAKTFILHYNERGLAMHAQVVERAEWVAAHYQAQTPAERRAVSQRDYAPPQDNSEDRLIDMRASNAASASANVPGALQPADATMATWEHRPEKFTFGLTPSFSQILGGPDAFALYQLGVAATAEYRITQSTWVNAALNWRLIDNFDKFTYTAPSGLPRVRTFQREYVTTKRLTMPVFQLTHVGRLNEDQYYSVYGGALEPMFAGFGAEWLYRPWRSRFALGVDINHVQQRDFAQDFKLRDYKVNTGHATLYWDTGWNGVQARISVGQYLAGDRGVSIDISRTFDNGVTIGAYATKTNVSAAQFGEGSFDKGIFISVPFDALLPRSSKFSANFTWAPLVRDGGAKLGRINPLYEMTTARDPRAFSFAPPDDNKPRAGDNILDFGPAR